jgi:hypothetical protein
MVAKRPKSKSNLPSFLNDYFNLVLAVILVIFLLGAYLLVLGPKIRDTKLAIQNNIDTQIRLYNNNQRKLANLKLVSSLYQKINPADLQKFNSVLPDKYVQERLFGELEEIIGAGGWVVNEIRLKIPEIKTSAPVVAAVDEEATDESGETTASVAATSAKKPGAIDPVGKISVDLSIQSVDYIGFKSLLKVLENNLRLFDVTSVNFSPEGRSATIQLTTYYYNKLK